MIPRREGFERANGLLLRGVVTTTYELDNTDHPEQDDTGAVDAVAIYCDVLVYSSMWNQRWQMLRTCLVTQEIGGMHRGRVWKPRATTIDITDPVGGYDLDRATNPAELDGDHVLIGFLDDNLNQPIVIRGIPHPSADTGNEEKIPGKRLRLKIADGDPDFWKHHGGFYGIDDNGDFVVDLTEANKGQTDSAGKEPEATTDGSSGNYKIKLPENSEFRLLIKDLVSFVLNLGGADATAVLGTGDVSVAIGEKLEALWGTLVGKLNAADAHIHPDAFGGTGPTTIPVVAPVYDTKINSPNLNIPDNP